MPLFSHNDHHLFYHQQGNGPLLLLLPGNTSSSAHHGEELAHFGQRYRAVALDFWGTGRSDKMPAWPLGPSVGQADDWWEQGARDAAALVEHLGYKHCVAVGTSGGAVVALLMTILFPQRVRAVIADSCVERWSPEQLQAAVAERARRTPEQVAFWQHAHGNDWQQVVNADTRLLRQLARRGGDWFNGRLGDIHCPVLFTASLRDEALLEIERQVCAMAKQIPNCRVFFVNRGGHPLIRSRPEALHHATDCFLGPLIVAQGFAVDNFHDPYEGDASSIQAATG